LFGEFVVGKEEATGEPGTILLWPERFLIGFLERERPEHLDPLTAGEHEEGRGGWHRRNVIAVINERRTAPRPIQVAEIQAIARSNDQVRNIGMGVEEGEGFFEEAVGVIRQHVAGGDEEREGEAVAVVSSHDTQNRIRLRGRVVWIVDRVRGVKRRGRPIDWQAANSVLESRGTGAAFFSELVVASPGVFVGILLPDRPERVAFLKGVPQLPLPMLVEGDAKADDFEDVLTGGCFC